MKISTAKKIVKTWEIFKIIMMLVTLIAIIALIIGLFFVSPIVMGALTFFIFLIAISVYLDQWWDNVKHLANQSEPIENPLTNDKK